MASPKSPSPGREPRANPAARWLAICVGAVLLALAVVCGRDLWYRYGLGDPANSWSAQALSWVATHEFGLATVAAGAAISLLGLWVALSALAPRVRTHVKVASAASIWVRPVDIARKATYTARAEIGRSRITSRATRKRLRVAVEDDGSGATVADKVTSALITQFAPLARAPRVSTSVLPRQAEPADTAREAENP